MRHQQPFARKLVLGAGLIIGVAAIAATASAQAPAAPEPTQALDNIASSFQTGAGVWLGRLAGIAQRLFVTLAGIEVAVSGIIWTIRRDSVDEIAAKFLLKFIALSFMLGLITAFGYWLPPLLNSFEAAGERAIGGATVSPSRIIDTGITLSQRVLAAFEVQGITDLVATGLVAGLTAILIELAYVGIAAMVLLTWIEGFVVLGGGVLFLGFAASRWSAAYAENFINYVVYVGVRLFLLYLVVGIGMSVTNDILPIIATPRTMTSDLTPLGQALGLAVTFLIISTRVPLSVAGRVTAGHSFGLANALRSL